MTEIENLTKAFQILRSYEEYQLKKAWGIMLMLFGILEFLVYIFYPLSFDIFMLFFRFFELFWDLEAHVGSLFLYYVFFTLLFPSILTSIVVLCTIYKYLSITKTKKEDGKLSFQYEIRFGLALFTIWFFPSRFFLLSFGIIISMFFFDVDILFINALYLLDIALAFLVSYFLLKGSVTNNEFKELLFSGLALIIGSSSGLALVGGLIVLHPSTGYILYNEIKLLLNKLTLMPLLYICYFFCGLYQFRRSLKMPEGDYDS